MTRFPSRTLAVLALVGALLAAPSLAAAAPVGLSFQRTPATQLRPQEDPNRAYANVDFISTEGCGRGKSPISVGWAGSGILTTGPSFYAGSPVTEGFRLNLRAPLVAARIQAITVCAAGVTGVTKVTKPAGAVASCPRGRTTLGVPVDRSWAYTEGALFGKPLGTNRFQSDAAGSSTALCVPAGRFTRVASVRKAGTIAAGARTGTVKATCARGTRALSWGYETAASTGNAWTADGNTIDAPFVSSSVPSANAWTLTFHTPDAKGAVAAVPVAAWVTCGVPAAR